MSRTTVSLKNLFRERTDCFSPLYIIIRIARRNYKKKVNYHGNCLTSLEAGSTGAINRLHHLVIVQYPIYIYERLQQKHTL